MHRDAPAIRDKAIGAASRSGLLVLAPSMPRTSFPKWRYEWAGIVREGAVQPRRQWTAAWLRAFFDWSRGLVAARRPKLYLFGHSAGAQLLARLRAYSPIRGLALNWHLVEVPGVGHSSRGMLASERLEQALRPARGARPDEA